MIAPARGPPKQASARGASARHRARDPLESLVNLVSVGGLDAEAAVVLAHLVGQLLREPPPRRPQCVLGIEVGDARRVDDDEACTVKGREIGGFGGGALESPRGGG